MHNRYNTNTELMKFKTYEGEGGGEETNAGGQPENDDFKLPPIQGAAASPKAEGDRTVHSVTGIHQDQSSIMPMAANAGREEGAMPKSKPEMERKKTKYVKEKTTPGGLLIPGIVSSEIE